MRKEVDENGDEAMKVHGRVLGVVGWGEVFFLALVYFLNTG